VKYIASIERTYYRAYNELKRINQERNKSTGIVYHFHASHRAKLAKKPEIQNEPRGSLVRESSSLILDS
jgi:hypothetical protein